MIEVKVKEREQGENFPALYSSEGRETVILVTKKVSDNKLEGVVLHPKSSMGSYSTTWSTAKYKRMGLGSELTLKIIQE